MVLLHVNFYENLKLWQKLTEIIAQRIERGEREREREREVGQRENKGGRDLTEATERDALKFSKKTQIKNCLFVSIWSCIFEKLDQGQENRRETHIFIILYRKYNIICNKSNI